MEQLIKQAITENRYLTFFYPASNDPEEFIQRQVVPITYGKDKNGTLKLRALENTIPKLWVMSKVGGLEIDEQHTFDLLTEAKTTDKNITEIIYKVGQ